MAGSKKKRCPYGVVLSALLLLMWPQLPDDAQHQPRAFLKPPAVTGNVRQAPWLFLPAMLAAAQPAAQAADSSGAAAVEAAKPAQMQSPEEMLMQWLNQYTGSQAGSGNGPGPSLAALGVGAFVLFSIVSVLKFLLAGAGGLFLVKEFDQQFGKEGRKTSKVIEKAVRRFAGEPADLLDERRLKVVRMNDEFVGFRAALAEQSDGPSAGAAVRGAARRKRFLRTWEHLLSELAISSEERQKVEEAVTKYAEEEQERQETLVDTRSNWLNSMLDNSFVASLSSRFQLTASRDKELKLQEDLVAAIRKALPDAKLSTLQKSLKRPTDLAWLVDRRSKHEAAAAEEKTVYVLDFDGDPSAAGVEMLSKEVTAILGSKDRPEEVVLRLKSPGGTVTGYGLAAAQLQRFRQHGVHLVACVDELAASGGYMMACCADRILCSPFAAIGSIGVISGIPNASERLEREGLKVIQTTAGKWKRTVDPFQPPSEEALGKAKEDVMMIYRQFSGFVKQNRPGVDIEKVATGEVWFGKDALDRGLVDELQTSSEYLLQHMQRGHEVLSLTYNAKPSGLAGLTSLAGASQERLLETASALHAMNAASEALGPGGSEVLQALRAAAATAGGSAAGSWPNGVPEPRVEASGPLGTRGNQYGF